MKKQLGSLVLFLAAAVAASAQSLPNQVLSLYPQNTGELVFSDLRTLRGSPHYPQLKSQVIPGHFQNLEPWVRALGIDFEKDVHQLSWMFAAGPAGGTLFAGIAEGRYVLDQVEQHARILKLAATQPAGQLMVSIGKNAAGQEFVFAFPDASTAIFGSRELAEDMLNRRAQGGGSSLLQNPVMRDLVGQLNGRAPIWFALDKQYTGIALRQLLPEPSQVLGLEDMISRAENATLRFELRDGMRGQAALRCRDSGDAMLFSTVTQAAVAFQSAGLRASKPDLARVLGNLRINRQDNRLDVELAMSEPDFAALLRTNSFALRF